MTINNQTIIGDIVASNYKAADVFSKYQIDYCCQGSRTLEEACMTNQVSSSDVLSELQNVLNIQNTSTLKYDEWPVDLLSEYVVKIHHKYVEESVPVLKQNLNKLCNVHGKNHTELFKITEAFHALADDVIVHMKKEELMLFPYIKKMKKAFDDNVSGTEAPFGTVANPIGMMQHDHTFEGDLLHSIQSLSDNFTPPSDGCTTYKVTYAKLKEFQDDMFLHIHLENNIMFPKAILLEEEIQDKTSEIN
jgi:regulator of cell morphogenesis and NO signaling